MGPCRVLVVDERQILAAGLARILEERPGIREANVLQEDRSLPAALASGYDVVLTNERHAARVMRLVCPQTRVVVAVHDSDAARIAQLLRLGAASICSTDDAAEDVATAVEQTARGETRLPSDQVREVLQELERLQRRAQDAEQTLALLTDRERDVLERLGRGEGRAVIARELGLSPHTVRTHLQHVMRKLRLHSQLEAAACARALDESLRTGARTGAGTVIDLDAERVRVGRGS